jgi:hypothetical protein
MSFSNRYTDINKRNNFLENQILSKLAEKEVDNVNSLLLIRVTKNHN